MPRPTLTQLPGRQRNKIYKVCVALLAANGYRHTTVKMITRRLKVADGYLHYYFTGKDDLFRWAIEVGLDQWLIHFRKNVELGRTQDLFELVKAVILQQIRYTREYPEAFSAYITVINEPHFPHIGYLLEKMSWIDHMFAEAIERAIRTGGVRPDAPPHLVAMMIDLIVTRMQEFAWDPNYDPLGIRNLNEPQIVEMIDRLMAMLRDGIGPQSSSARRAAGGGCAELADN